MRRKFFAALIALFPLLAPPKTATATTTDYAAVDAMLQDFLSNIPINIAITVLTERAENGDLTANYALGIIYGEGRNVTQDFVKAAKWYRLAAVQGHAGAQFSLGFMYGNGQGVPQNHAEAAKWYRAAAVQGHARAQRFLGVMYVLGMGVPQNAAEGVKWYRLAAEQGYASAQFSLGAMYVVGRGVPQNLVLAHMWFNLAGAQGDTDASEHRDRIALRMTPAQIAEAQRLAAEWKPKQK